MTAKEMGKRTLFQLVSLLPAQTDWVQANLYIKTLLQIFEQLEVPLSQESMQKIEKQVAPKQRKTNAKSSPKTTG